jgi:hypothetical protein
MECVLVKIAVFTPLSHAKAVRKALAEAGAGQLGHYDYCSFSVRGTGRFRPLKGAKPFLGTAGVIEEVDEEKIEVICPIAKLDSVLAAVREVHPYEEPAIDVYPLLNRP